MTGIIPLTVIKAMNEELLSPNDLARILNDEHRNIILHTMNGEIIGASPCACRHLGYTAEELMQLLYANIKAHKVRLSDVCTIRNEEDSPVILLRRNGRRFAATVKSQVLRALTDREPKSIVMVEFSLKQESGSQSNQLPHYDLQESIDYLQLLGAEMQQPLLEIGLFLEELTHFDLPPDTHAKLTALQFSRTQLAEMTADVVDWFKIGINTFKLDKHPFNLVELLDDITLDVNSLCGTAGTVFSVCVDSAQMELVFGDLKRVRQLLLKLTTKVIIDYTPAQVQLYIEPDTEKSDFSHVGVKLVVLGCETGLTEPRDPPRDENDQTEPMDASMGITAKLITIMGGQLSRQPLGDTALEFNFSLLLPDVDMLSLQGNGRFLAGSKVLLVDEQDSALKHQLACWGANVESLPNAAKAADYISRLSAASGYALTLINPSEGTDVYTAIEALRNAGNRSPTVCIKAGVDCLLDVEGISMVPAPFRPGMLGNMLALLLDREVPYPYGNNQRTRVLDLNSARNKILFVDDVESIRRTFLAILEKAGYEVDLAHNGIDAILACYQKQYDVIVIDAQMPFMDGYEAAHHIRKSHNSNATTPILAVSGDISENARVSLESVGVRDILLKPVATGQFLKKIEQLVGGTATAAEQDGAPDVKDLLLTPSRRAHEKQKANTQPDACLNKELLRSLIEDTSLNTCIEMIETFVEESQRSVSSIDQEVLYNNWDKVMREIHAIKSTSYTFGCDALYKAVEKLEAQIESGDKINCLQTVNDIADVFTESHLALQNFFREIQNQQGGGVNA